MFRLITSSRACFFFSLFLSLRLPLLSSFVIENNSLFESLVCFRNSENLIVPAGLTKWFSFLNSKCFLLWFFGRLVEINCRHSSLWNQPMRATKKTVFFFLWRKECQDIQIATNWVMKDLIIERHWNWSFCWIRCDLKFFFVTKSHDYESLIDNNW